MGMKLEKYYELVGAKGGMQARMRLAMKTGISSVSAKTAPDTPENLSKFFEAAKEFLGAETPRL